ncbi:hypothetical protein AO372_1006 [Moraxella catarrhalis]|nr:hypothetical protein AO372_1006 [Moraxella catarrhalis]
MINSFWVVELLDVATVLVLVVGSLLQAVSKETQSVAVVNFNTVFMITS